MKQSRRQRSEAQLRSLEQQFSSDLGAALRECASGNWGMFGQNDHAIEREGRQLREMLASNTAQELLKKGKEIEHLRQRLGFTKPFPLFKRFLEYREMRGPNVPGEPKLAAQFLEELGVK